MRISRLTPLAILALAACTAQSPPMSDSRSVADGGVGIQGWTGRVDASEAAAGLTLDDAKLSMSGNVMSVTTGPALAYWNPANVARGNYTVRARFHEPLYMNVNDHPHPYGIFIGGQNMGTDRQSYLYCAAYGSGAFIVRGFGPDAFQMNGRRPEMHDAVHKAASKNTPVTQDIAVTVSNDSVSCAINGTTVATYPKADVLGMGKLSTTDGVYGVRFGHNTDATVTGLTLERR